MQPLSGNLRPDLCSVLRRLRQMHLTDPLQMSHLPLFLEMLQIPHVLLTFDKVRNPSAKRHLNVLRTRQFCLHF